MSHGEKLLSTPELLLSVPSFLFNIFITSNFITAEDDPIQRLVKSGDRKS